MANLPYPNSYLGIPEEEETLIAPDGTPVQVSVPVANPSQVSVEPEVVGIDQPRDPMAIPAANMPLPGKDLGPAPKEMEDPLPEQFEPQSAITPTQQEYDTASQYSRELARSGNETAAQDAQKEVDAYAGAGSPEGEMAKRTISAQGEMMDAQAQAIGTQTEKARAQYDAVQQYHAGVQMRLDTAQKEAEAINMQAQKAGEDVGRQVAEDQEAMRKNRDKNPFFSNTSLADGIGLALSLAIGNWHARKTGSENMAVKILQQRIGQAVQMQEAERADLVKAYDRNVAKYDQIEADRVRNQQTLEYKTAIMISAAEEKFNEQLAGIDQSALDQEQLDNLAEMSAFFKGAKADATNQAIGMASARKAEEAKMAIAMAKSRGSGGGGGSRVQATLPDIVDRILELDPNIKEQRAERERLSLQLQAANPEQYKVVESMIRQRGELNVKDLTDRQIMIGGVPVGLVMDVKEAEKVRSGINGLDRQVAALQQLQKFIGDNNMGSMTTKQIQAKFGSEEGAKILAAVNSVFQEELSKTSFEEGPNGMDIVARMLGIDQGLSLQSFNTDIISSYVNRQADGYWQVLQHNNAGFTQKQTDAWNGWRKGIDAKVRRPASKGDREAENNRAILERASSGKREDMMSAIVDSTAQLMGNPGSTVAGSRVQMVFEAAKKANLSESDAKKAMRMAAEKYQERARAGEVQSGTVRGSEKANAALRRGEKGRMNVQVFNESLEDAYARAYGNINRGALGDNYFEQKLKKRKILSGK